MQEHTVHEPVSPAPAEEEDPPDSSDVDDHSDVLNHPRGTSIRTHVPYTLKVQFDSAMTEEHVRRAIRTLYEARPGKLSTCLPTPTLLRLGITRSSRGESRYTLEGAPATPTYGFRIILERDGSTRRVRLWPADYSV